MSNHFTPCDIPDENNEHHCPFADTYSGYEDEMCRNCCGLGVDEDSYPEEEEYEDGLFWHEGYLVSEPWDV